MKGLLTLVLDTGDLERGVVEADEGVEMLGCGLLPRQIQPHLLELSRLLLLTIPSRCFSFLSKLVAFGLSMILNALSGLDLVLETLSLFLLCVKR